MWVELIMRQKVIYFILPFVLPFVCCPKVISFPTLFASHFAMAAERFGLSKSGYLVIWLFTFITETKKTLQLSLTFKNF